MSGGTYRAKPQLVMAVQATEAMRVGSFAGVGIPVLAGEWVVRDENDEARVLSDEAFRERYEPIPDKRGTPYVCFPDEHTSEPYTTMGYRYVVLFTVDATVGRCCRPANEGEVLRGQWIDEGTRRS